MRYTTSRFGEIAYLPGEFQAGLSGVVIALFDMSTPTAPAIPVSTSGCVEMTGTTVNGFSTYVWPSSGIVTQPTEQTQYLYVMRDPTTERVQKGKFILGGFTDESALGRYGGQAHITPDGTPLPTIASGTATCTFTTSGIIRSTGSWVADGFSAAIGLVLQVRPNALNRGLTPALVSITTTTNPNDTLNFYPSEPFTPEGPTAGVTVLAKRFTVPAGTDAAPVLDFYDARQIADALGFSEYHVHGGVSLSLDFNHDGWIFEGEDQSADTIAFVSGVSNVGARLSKLRLIGNLVGRILGDNLILENVSGVEGVFQTSALSNVVGLASGGEFAGDKIASRNTLPGAIVDFSPGGASSFLAGSVQGIFTVINASAGDTIGMSLAGTILTIHPSCTGGTIQAVGYGTFTYTPGSGPTFLDEVLRGSRLDVAVTTRLAAVSGATLTNATVSGVADQVWDEPISGHTVSGSTGRNLLDARRHITNRRRIVSGAGWLERVYDDNETTVLQDAVLKDLAGVDISDSNRPAGTLIAERDPV